MKTFIVLTFGFLAFAFYEMSGGAEFQPASVRYAGAPAAAPQDSATAPAAQDVPASGLVETASISKIDSTPSVTRVALNLATISEAPEPQETQTAAPQAPAPQAPEPAATPRPALTQATVIDSALTPQIILPSLIATTTTNGEAVQGGDLRTVSGNRVNVRGGPSTNYGIVSKLARGDQVRILEDNGNGWVRMQPVDGGAAGWMADFLLTSG